MSDSFATLWTVAPQAHLSMGFSKQEYWSGLPFPSPGDLPGPGIKLVSPALADRFYTSEPPEKPEIFLGGVYALSLSLLFYCQVRVDSISKGSSFSLTN